jgi:RecA-family ATPase
MGGATVPAGPPQYGIPQQQMHPGQANQAMMFMQQQPVYSAVQPQDHGVEQESKQKVLSLRRLFDDFK